ncbi:MAG: 2OG-Fe(II) oxygenase [Magnetovibrio sp.]|nr:2OG-Fe(II) oxygenase [Magnetovibrio sp.]|tara:strand:+ start:291 stop:902 length:612 start_codon:yes stop_codon:yes gene_type:complete
MKRLNLFSDKSPHFIGSWMLEPLSICDDLIAFFKANKDKQINGQTAHGRDLSVKKSVDLTVLPGDESLLMHSVIKKYMGELYLCYRDYLELWPFLKDSFNRMDVGPFNIQQYKRGGHFQQFHAERDSIQNCHRVLAWMTYLNTVDDGGETNFLHYDIGIPPICGQTLIWPADWTHAHCGNVINTGTKYIITGWLHFPPKNLKT